VRLRQATAEGGRWGYRATPLLLAAMLASGVLIVVLSTRLTFLLDDWTFILDRRGFDLDAFLRPSNEHLVAGPTAVWKLIIATFGIDSTLPFRLVSTAMFLLGSWFLFVWLRRRIGEWPAAIATLPILFLGAAADDLLWLTASLFFLGGVLCGLGMLLALDRRNRAGDRIACAWLVGAMLFSSLWVAFAAGAAVDVFLRRRERDWIGRAFIVLVPLALYVIWWLGWGHEAQSQVSLHNLATTPRYVFDSFAAALAAFFGLATPVDGVTSPAGLEWGRPLAILFGALAARRLYRLDRIPRTFWVVLTIALAFWALGGLAQADGRVPWDTRYQYPSVVLALLVAAELLRGVRLEARLLAPALIVVATAVAGNVLYLDLAYKSYKRTSEIERADLAAVEIARDHILPGLVLTEDIADTGYVSVSAASYLSARDAYGSPADSEAELTVAPPEARIPADKVLATALGIRLGTVAANPAIASSPLRLSSPANARPGSQRGCLTVGTGATDPAVLTLPPAGVVLRPRGGGEVDASLRRFADSFPVELGAVPPGTWSQIPIPRDRSSRPWQLRLAGIGAVELCGRGG
jgi:hypothetical protein